MPDFPRIACIGECMIELRQFSGGTAQVGYAGDTLNTAVYLSRLCPGAVSYVTNLGTDAFSGRMIDSFHAEGLDCRLIGRHPTRLPGVYAIDVDAAGERSFSYWRDTSAARTLFAGVGARLEDLAGFAVVYLSGITLAIVPPNIRNALMAWLAQARQGGAQVMFDCNYRPRLWPDVATARAAIDRMWTVCTLALPSRDDAAALYPGLTPVQVLDRISALGVPEVVLKSGAGGPVIRAGATDLHTAFVPLQHVADTTGAGDSFNAGYIAARLTGLSPQQAAVAGHALAARVIGQHGAIIPIGDMP